MMKVIKVNSFFDGTGYVKKPAEIVIDGASISSVRLSHSKRKTSSLNARFATPAFIDSHIHIAGYSKSIMTVNLTGVTTIEELKRRLKNAPKVSGWVLGRGWESSHLDFIPNKNILDKIFPDTPCSLRSRCGHSLWINSAALNTASITAKTKPPNGGLIEQDEKGDLTGILKENAITLVERVAPSLSESSTFSKAMKVAFKNLVSYGIGAICVVAEPNDVENIRKANPKFPMRILVEEKPSKILSLDEFDFDGVKLYKDGALGNSGALMSRPYAGTKNFGIEVISDSELEKELLTSLGRVKIFAVHAIGDLAVETVVRLFARHSEEAQKKKTILRVEHFQTASIITIRRAGRFNIIASVQPIQQYGDVEAAKQRLKTRARLMYRLRSMLDAGVKLAFGTDAPVEPPDTWRNIQAALDIGKEGVYADESISLLEAMKGYTSSAALASNFPALGRIKKGASATIALYDEDPFEYVLKGKDLKELRPVSVIVEGETLL